MPIKYSKLSNYETKKIINCFCADISDEQTAIILRINRNTINCYFLIFREVIFKKQQSDLELFFGVIELDEAYFGRKRLRGINMPQKCGRGTWKQPVFGVFERDRRVYTELVPNARQATLRKAIRGKIDIESLIITDGTLFNACKAFVLCAVKSLLILYIFLSSFVSNKRFSPLTTTSPSVSASSDR